MSGKTPSTAAAILLISILTVASGQNVQSVIDNPNGLQVAWNPTSGSLGIWRQLPKSTTPAPTGGSTPPMTTPPAGSTTPPPPTSSMPAGSSPSSSSMESSSALPPPTTTTSPPEVPMTGRINVTIGSIQELDSNNSVITSFNSFQTVGQGSPLTMNPPVMVPNLPGSTVQMPVQASCRSAYGPLPISNVTTAPIFNVTLCVVTASGSVSYNAEAFPMLTGQLVVSVQVKNWQWTTAGSNLMLNLTISVPSGRQISMNSQNVTSPVNMSLGASSSYALLSAMVTSDYVHYVQMASGYPAVSLIPDNKQTASVVVMMPKLAGQQATWNGLIDPGYTPAGPPPGPVSAAARLHGVLSSALFALACCVVALVSRH